MRFLYNIGIFLYGATIHLCSVFNDKAKSWKRGRQYIFASLHLQLKRFDHIIWIHCASYGEFEQGKPLINKIREQYPGYKILLTFFSPSGYEHAHNYEKADYVFYLPLDTRRNAKRFIDIVHPEYIFFVKYEYWFNYIHEAYRRKIPFYIISAIFRDSQYFFKPHGSWFRKQLREISYFFVQDENSQKLLQSIGISQCGVYGDTRFDTVVQTARDVKQNEIVRRFSEGKNVLIAGSTWEPDEKLLHQLLDTTDYSLILTPHEVHPSHMDDIHRLFADYAYIDYTEAVAKEKQDFSNIRILIIDTIGLLKHLYPYGKIAYIGGGFGKGIHNTLEAATFGMPVLFGPKYSHFKEACDLIRYGAAYSIRNIDELVHFFRKLTEDDENYKEACLRAREYVSSQTGVSEKILQKVFHA